MARKNVITHAETIRMTRLVAGSFGRVDLGDISPWKFNEGGGSLIRRIGAGQSRDSGFLAVGERIRDVANLVSCHLPAIGIRKMTVRHEDGHDAEGRFNTNPAIRIRRPPDLHTWCARNIGDYLAVRERKKAAGK